MDKITMRDEQEEKTKGEERYKRAGLKRSNDCKLLHESVINEFTGFRASRTYLLSENSPGLQTRITAVNCLVLQSKKRSHD